MVTWDPTGAGMPSSSLLRAQASPWLQPVPGRLPQCGQWERIGCPQYSFRLHFPHSLPCSIFLCQRLIINFVTNQENRGLKGKCSPPLVWGASFCTTPLEWCVWRWLTPPQATSLLVALYSVLWRDPTGPPPKFWGGQPLPWHLVGVSFLSLSHLGPFLAF